MQKLHSRSDSDYPSLFNHDLPALLDEKSLAAWLHVNIRTLQNWQRHGQFPEPVKFGDAAQSMKMFLVDEIREWIERKIQDRPRARTAAR